MTLKTLISALFILLIQTSCDAKKPGRGVNRLTVLERRMNTESNRRSEEIATIFTKVDDLERMINESLEFHEIATLPDGGNEMMNSFVAEKLATTQSDVDELKYYIQQLFRAFAQEKQTNAEIRDIMPEMRNKLKQNEKIVTDLKNDNERLSAHQQKLADENQRLSEKLQNVTKEMTLRIQKISEKCDELVLNYTLAEEEIIDPENRANIFSSCKDALDKGRANNGVYDVKIKGGTQIIQVYCDQITNNGGWIVFQRRVNGLVDFYRGWEEYKEGFGTLNAEFWLGNEFLHEITANGEYELRIDMEDFDGSTGYAEYSTFKINAESEKYKLEVSGYQGNASDSLTIHHNGRKFSTKDSDNDDHKTTNCANKYNGAWWYTNCLSSNLNGKYYKTGMGKGIIWYFWKKSLTNSLKFVEMKMREKTD